MLPDLPSFKSRIYKIQIDFFHWAQQEQMGIFGVSQYSPIYEGNSHTIERQDGYLDKNEFDKITWELTLEPSSENLDSVFTKLYDAATKSAEMFERQSLDQLDKTLTRAGQTVKSNFDDPIEFLIQAYEKIQFPLDKNGNLDLSNQRIFVGTDLYNKFKNLKETDDQKKRINQILKQKLKEAHAREANRKLVG